MSIPRRIILIASSVFLILFIALSLARNIEVRGPPPEIIQVTVAQAARVGEAGDTVAAKALLNETGFDRGDVWHGTSIISGVKAVPTAMTETQEGLIRYTSTPVTSASWDDEGVIGPIPTPTPSAVPAPGPPPAAQIPILALTYSSSGGPKHCRGELLQKTYFQRPIEQWKNGTCINLPSEARCGVFFSSKADNCEAQLFNTADCLKTTQSYVNTVVFMSEERAIGALWSSMWVRCGVDVPEAKILDPSILGGALRKKPGTDALAYETRESSGKRGGRRGPKSRCYWRYLHGKLFLQTEEANLTQKDISLLFVVLVTITAITTIVFIFAILVIIAGALGRHRSWSTNSLWSLSHDEIMAFVANAHKVQLRNTLVDLLLALQSLPASRLLPSKRGNKDLLGDLLSLNPAIYSNNFDTTRIRPLLDAVLDKEPDEVIWDKVYNALTESTPPPRPASSIQQTPWLRSTGSIANSTKYRKYVDEVLKEELGEIYVGIPRFFEAFFGEVAGLGPAARAVFDKCK
ncbi:hypothetical protein EJ02DRAFT_439253 [Clathrospora elynae]|uniref:Uncharacterized protein n=1 Tax=Clathrospora elynae TaxID=706981 RepID=A0A6A5S7E3_9PLEO|nr:hypothetical protein EJ02DRAFT_439253 [Clathrospora elynae]